jgi:hypothetical protein
VTAGFQASFMIVLEKGTVILPCTSGLRLGRAFYIRAIALQSSCKLSANSVNDLFPQ